MIIELIRHGETVLQARKCYQGAIDVPLSDQGRQKLEKGRQKLEEGRQKPEEEKRKSEERNQKPEDVIACRRETDPEQVYVSPLQRARETARILFPDAEQIIIPDLEEMHFGSFEGKNYLDMENDPEYRAWVDGMCLGRCPGGESRQEFSDRTARALNGILRMEAERRQRSETEAERRQRREIQGPETWRRQKSEAEAGRRQTEAGTGMAADSDQRIVIVAHGGTQMALLDRFAVTSNAGTGSDSSPDYYSWQLGCGQGYLLGADLVHGQPELRILGTRDYTGG